MRISVIVAIARNGVIGYKGKMPWHLPEDLKHFKAITMGHPIVMGRKTYESIGRILPGRTTIIITRQRNYAIPGALIVQSLSEALKQAQSDEVFVIGGGEIYREVMPVADRVYLTRIELDPDGDTSFPALEANQWREISSESGISADGIEYRFEVLDRIRPAMPES